MIAVLPVVGGSDTRILWYVTRATGLAALVLLTTTLVVGIVASVGWTSRRWPRFASQTLHRNLSLLSVTFVVVHVVTTLADSYVPMHVVATIVPFTSTYQRFWVGLGAAAFDLLLAVLLTSALRRRIGPAAWRLVHWSAYVCWPVAFAHALGSGTDQGLSLVVVLDATCAAAVAAATGWRLLAGRHRPVGRPVPPAAPSVVAGDRWGAVPSPGSGPVPVRSRGGTPW